MLGVVSPLGSHLYSSCAPGYPPSTMADSVTNPSQIWLLSAEMVAVGVGTSVMGTILIESHAGGLVARI